MPSELKGLYRCKVASPHYSASFAQSVHAAIKRLAWTVYRNDESNCEVRAKSEPWWRELLYFPCHLLKANWYSDLESSGVQLDVTVKSMGSFFSDEAGLRGKLKDILQVFDDEARARLPVMTKWEYYDFIEASQDIRNKCHRGWSSYWKTL